MSTAAQQARRKIAQPKSRFGRSTTPTTSSGTFGQQQPSGSLFSFGGSNTSQSFPPPQQQQFQFSVPGASTSFTFGSTNNNAQPMSNPFANLNGNINGGGAQNENSSMQDSQQRPSNNLFGSTANPSAPTTNGFTGFNFGQPAEQQPSVPSTNPFSFGQTKTQEKASNETPFGSQPQTNGFGFGQTSQASTGPSLFGQSSSSTTPAFSGFGTSAPATESAPAPAPTFKFGETTVVPATAEPKVENATPKPKSLFAFGQTATFGKPSSDAAPATEPPKPAFSFGQPAATSQPESTPSKPNFVFGQPAATPQVEPASAPAKPSSLTFGQPAGTSNSQAPTMNMFGSPSKPAESSSTGSLFGRTSPATETPPPAEEPNPADRANQSDAPQPTDDAHTPKNPFASLFAHKPSSEPASESARPKPIFSFGQGNSFAPPSNQTLSASTATTGPASSKLPDAPATADMTKSTFPFPTPNPSSGGLFSPQPAAEAAPSSNLFNLNRPTPAAGPKEDERAPVKSASTRFGTNPSAFNSSAGSTPSKALGQTTTHAEADDAFDETSRPAKKRLFSGTSTPESMAQSAGISLDNRTPSAPTEPVQPRPTQPQKPAQPQETINRAVSTEGPPQIPRYLSADKYKSYDENWRLKSLNRRFQQVISTRDPDKHDLLNAIQNYLDHREAIGAPGLEGHERRKLDVAGNKRKAVDVDDLHEVDAQNKKSKANPTFSTSTPQSTTASNIFASVASPKATATSSPARPSDSATSNLFKSMIPGAVGSSLGFTPSFRSAPAPTSTTPPSSPPKSDAPQLAQFEMPKFGSGASVNFANAFAQAAAKDSAKFEKEEREKRKAEEFDSDEDDEEAWNRKYEEEQKAKKAKLEAAMQGGSKGGFVPSASSSRSNSLFSFNAPVKSIETDAHAPSGLSKQVFSLSEDDDEEEESGTGDSGNSGDDEHEHTHDEQQDEDVEEEEEEEEGGQGEEGLPIPDLAPSDSLFGRLDQAQVAKRKAGQDAKKTMEEPISQPAPNKSHKDDLLHGNIGKSTPDAPHFSPITPASGPKGNFVPTTTFNFTPTPATSGPAFGALKEGPIPGEGLFGSRPSTPQPSTGGETKPANNAFPSVFGSKPVGGTDHTWQKGSPIRFNNERDPPSVEVTAATPPAKEQPKKIFGEATSSSFTNPPVSNGTFTGFTFGGPKPPASSSAPAPGFLSAASHLTASNLASATSSRATSPGITSEAESVATDNTEDYSNDPQTSLITSNSGEENEAVLYESRAALSRNYKKSEVPEKSKIIEGWNKIGSGTVKVLKHKESGKSRIVFRAEPGANILLNTRLIGGAKYSSSAVGNNGAVTFPVATEKGMQLWMIKVKTKNDSDRLAEVMDSNKGN